MTDISSEIPRDVSDLLTDLSVLAGIPPDSKYNVHNKTYVSASSWIGSMERTVFHYLYNEKGETTVEDFTNKIKLAVIIARKNPAWKNMILQHIKALEQGITNSIHVYSRTPNLCAKFKTLLLLIDPNAFENACKNIDETTDKCK